MNQIIKIIENKIIEVSKASQQGQKEYNEEYEKVLRSLFFDDGKIKEEIEKKEVIEEELRSENEELKERINKARESNEKALENSEKFWKELRSHSGSREKLNDEIRILAEDLQIKSKELEKEKNDATKRAIQQERENEAIVKQLEEERQKVEDLEEAKERLLQKNKELSDDKKNLKVKINRLEKTLESYVNSSSNTEVSIETAVSENVAQVAKKREQEKVKEELVVARQLLEANQTEKEIQEKKIEEYEEKLKELSEENISLQERIRVYEIFVSKEKLTTPSPTSSQHNSLNVKPGESIGNSLRKKPWWEEQNYTYLELAYLVEDLDDEIDDLKAEIKELKKPLQEKQTPSESDQNQKTTSQPNPQDPSLRRNDSSNSLSSAGRVQSRSRSGSRRSTGDTRKLSLEKRLSPTMTTITENPLVNSPTSENNGFSFPVSESPKDSTGDSHSTTENDKDINYTSNDDKLNKLEEEQQNDLQQEVPANFQSMTNEQQILQKERNELQCQIIDKLNKQLAEAKYNLSLAKKYLNESRADLATSQENAANLVIEKRKEMLRFSAENNRLKAKNVELAGRFGTATEKNVELSEKLKKEEERNNNFHDEVVKLKEKLANQEVELKNKEKDAKGKEKEIIEEKDGEENTGLAEESDILEEHFENISGSEDVYNLGENLTKLWKIWDEEEERNPGLGWAEAIKFLFSEYLDLVTLNNELASKVNLAGEVILKIFEWFENDNTSQVKSNLIAVLIKDKSELKEKIAELEEKLSIQNPTPQQLTEEDCKNCPIKEAKIVELKTALEQANQDWKTKYQELEKSKVQTKYRTQTEYSTKWETKLEGLTSKEQEWLKETSMIYNVFSAGAYREDEKFQAELIADYNKNYGKDGDSTEKQALQKWKETIWKSEQGTSQDNNFAQELGKKIEIDPGQLVDVISNLERMIELSQKTKSKNEELATNLETAEKSEASENPIQTPTTNPILQTSDLIAKENSLKELLTKKDEEITRLKNRNEELINYSKKLGYYQDFLSMEEAARQGAKITVWQDIHPYFIVDYLVEKWTRRGFTHEQVRDWIGIGLGVGDAGYAAWLRDRKKVDDEWVLDYGNDEELRDEYAKFREGVGTQTDLKKEDWENKEREIVSIQEAYQKLQEDYEELETNLTEIQNTNQRNEKVIEDLQTEVAKKEEIMMGKIAEKGVELDLLKTATGERDKWRGESVGWETKYREATNSAKTKQKETKKSLEILSQKNTELIAQIDNHQEEKEQLNKQIKELERKLFVLGNLSKTLSDDYRETEGKLKKSHAANAFLTEQSRQKQMEIDSLNLEIGKIQTELDQAQQEKDCQQQRANDLEVENANLRTDLTQEQNQAKTLETDLEERQKSNENLKIQITALTNERDEVLTNHQVEQNAHRKAKIERDNYKSKVDNHVCPVSCQEPCCLGDYEKLKNRLATQKNKIFTKINNSLELGLTGQITLPNLIKKIKELINKPPVIDNTKTQELENELTKAQQTIFQLEEQIRKTPSPAPQEEKLAVIIQVDLKSLEQLFRHKLDHQVLQKIEKAQNYQELVKVREDFIHQQTQKNLADLSAIQTEKTNLIKQQKIERIIMISLLVASLLTLSGLLAKLKMLSSKKSKKTTSRKPS